MEEVTCTLDALDFLLVAGIVLLGCGAPIALLAFEDWVGRRTVRKRRAVRRRLAAEDASRVRRRRAYPYS